MRPIKNNTPDYAILYPIGSKLEWTWKGGDTKRETIIVKGHVPPDANGCIGCIDCDRIRYLDEHGARRCHYRDPKSVLGLRYWRRIE